MCVCVCRSNIEDEEDEKTFVGKGYGGKSLALLLLLLCDEISAKAVDACAILDPVSVNRKAKWCQLIATIFTCPMALKRNEFRSVGLVYLTL